MSLLRSLILDIPLKGIAARSSAEIPADISLAEACTHGGNCYFHSFLTHVSLFDAFLIALSRLP
jgi:hypothetical protein